MPKLTPLKKDKAKPTQLLEVPSRRTSGTVAHNPNFGITLYKTIAPLFLGWFDGAKIRFLAALAVALEYSW